MQKHRRDLEGCVEVSEQCGSGTRPRASARRHVVTGQALINAAHEPVSMEQVDGGPSNSDGDGACMQPGGRKPRINIWWSRTKG